MNRRPSASPALDLTRAPREDVLSGARRCVATGRSMITGGRVDVRSVPPRGHLVTVTSGSSGSPRAILRTLASWTESYPDFSRLTGITAGDRVALTGSPQVSLHLFAALHADWLGSPLVSDLRDASVVHCVPTVLDDLLAQPLPRLRLAVIAGSVLSATLAGRAADRGIELVEYYGAAELSLVAIGPPGRLLPFPGCRIELRDRELWVNSPWLSRGYLDGSSCSDRSGPFRTGPFRTDDRGFATVGDLASAQAGTITILGRGDAAITVGGTTVLAADVESVLRDAPGVRTACVVPRAHDHLGQIVAAVVELDGDAQLETIKRRVRERLDGAALPRHWLVVDRLPRGAGGKVDRPRLTQLVGNTESPRP